MKMLLSIAALAALAGPPALAETAVHDMGATHTSTAAKTGQGVGRVKAVDATAGKVTLHHGPVSALGWPAMTMQFSAAPALLQGVKTGQTVRFTATDGEVPTLTEISPQ